MIEHDWVARYSFNERKSLSVFFDKSLSCVGCAKILKFMDEAKIHVFYFALKLSIFFNAQRSAVNDQVVARSIVPILPSEQSFPFGYLLALHSF